MSQTITSAPWQVTIMRPNGITCFKLLHHIETSIAVDPSDYWEDGHPYIIDDYGYIQPDAHMDCDQHHIANARLIAAAPDLLKALQDVLAVADRSTLEFDMARIAILKATGVKS